MKIYIKFLKIKPFFPCFEYKSNIFKDNNSLNLLDLTTYDYKSTLYGFTYKSINFSWANFHIICI